MSSEKTEEPTPKKLAEARRRGQVPRSRELVAGLSLFASALVLDAVGPHLYDALRLLTVRSLDGGLLGSPPEGVIEAGLLLVAPSFASLSILLFSVVALAAFAQVGPLFAPRALLPEPRRLDPVQGLRRLFDPRKIVELSKSLAILGLVLFVGVRASRDALPGLLTLPRSAPTRLLPLVGGLAIEMMATVGASLTFLGLADLAYQRFRHRKDLRMSKEEVRREHRDREGDPHLKQRRAQAHREAVEHRAIEEVRRADVLVVNPTHVAVALCFDESSEAEAPEVLAKGVDHLARRMIGVAREEGVPVVRDVPLARALYELEVGDAIPEPLYDAVAVVLAEAWSEREERET